MIMHEAIAVRCEDISMICPSVGLRQLPLARGLVVKPSIGPRAIGFGPYAKQCRRAYAAEAKHCLTKLREGQASFTKLTCHPPVLACAAATETLLCESLPIFPELCETFPALPAGQAQGASRLSPA